MKRREVLKSALGSVVATSINAQEQSGPFSQPSATFNPKNVDQIPGWAFRDAPIRPPVPRPTFIGDYQAVTDHPRPFGPADPIRCGDVFHGIAREWGETPKHWAEFGLNPDEHPKGLASWKDKQENFGEFFHFETGERVKNWGGFNIKCYKMPIRETYLPLANMKTPARLYAYGGKIPGPMYVFRIGQPVVVRYENQLETEVSVHLHGGHSPSHSDGFPSFYVLQGKSRDYFYPHILPLKKVVKKTPEQQKSDKLKFEAPGEPDLPVTKACYKPDLGEAQSCMWYHDHGMDATGYNVSKGLAGMAKCFGDRELKLIKDGVLPGLGPRSCFDPEIAKLDSDGNYEDPENPGYYHPDKEPYLNPFDHYLVLQDRILDPTTGQVSFDSQGHNGYLGEVVLVNGVAWPKLEVKRWKYRFRILDGSNARIYNLRLLSEKDYQLAHERGIDAVDGPLDAAAEVNRKNKYDEISKPFLRIGKDSWLWSKPLLRKNIVLPMANRADIVVDFQNLAADIPEGEEAVFYLVNTMPQTDGRGPRVPLADGGDPRVLPLPFETVATPDGLIKTTAVAELAKPIALMKIVVKGTPKKEEYKNLMSPEQYDKWDFKLPTVNTQTILNPHAPIEDHEVQAVREFVFQRGRGAWMINKRFYDPLIANATPTLGTAEEWVLRNPSGGWWHPIHIHLESHQLVSYEKDFQADGVIDTAAVPAENPLGNLVQVSSQIPEVELIGLHDTMVLGPNTVARIRMRFRTWEGPFVFHCHNLEHEDMRMMHNFEPVPRGNLLDPMNPNDLKDSDHANVAPDARTHGNDVTLQLDVTKLKVGELPWEQFPVPRTPTRDAGEFQIPARKRPGQGKK